MRPCQTTPLPAKTITFEHKCGNIYVQYTLRPKLHSTRLTQNSDFSNERLRKRGRSPAAAYPFWRGRTAAALCHYVMAALMYPKVQRSLCSKCVETKLQEGKLRSQPWLMSRVHTNSHCYEYSPFHAVSRRSRVLAFHVCTKYNANY